MNSLTRSRYIADGGGDGLLVSHVEAGAHTWISESSAPHGSEQAFETAVALFTGSAVSCSRVWEAPRSTVG